MSRSLPEDGVRKDPELDNCLSSNHVPLIMVFKMIFRITLRMLFRDLEGDSKEDLRGDFKQDLLSS